MRGEIPRFLVSLYLVLPSSRPSYLCIDISNEHRKDLIMHANISMPFRNLAIMCLLVIQVVQASELADVKVSVIRTPGGGVQPQAAVDGSGTLHLIYFKGDPKAGDIFYVRRKTGAMEFSEPLRVNSKVGSCIAIGTIRGAQMALGKNGRVHVSWMGSDQAEPVMIREKKATPMLYTRLGDDGKSFEPERNVLTFAAGLD